MQAMPRSHRYNAVKPLIIVIIIIVITVCCRCSRFHRPQIKYIRNARCTFVRYHHGKTYIFHFTLPLSPDAHTFNQKFTFENTFNSERCLLWHVIYIYGGKTSPTILFPIQMRFPFPFLFFYLRRLSVNSQAVWHFIRICVRSLFFFFSDFSWRIDLQPRRYWILKYYIRDYTLLIRTQSITNTCIHTRW